MNYRNICDCFEKFLNEISIQFGFDSIKNYQDSLCHQIQASILVYVLVFNNSELLNGWLTGIP